MLGKNRKSKRFELYQVPNQNYLQNTQYKTGSRENET